MKVRTLACTGAMLAMCATVVQAQRADTTTSSQPPELRFSFTTLGATRAAASGSNAVSEASSRLNGIELVARSPRSGGVMLRYAKGDFGSSTIVPSEGTLEYLDGRLFIGPRNFAAALGYTGRTFAYQQKKRRFDLARGGLQLTYQFDGAGVGLTFAGSYLRTVTKAKADSLEAYGLEGETALLYVPPKYPVFVQIGYRREVFNVTKKDDTLRREELSGVLLAVGVQYGLSLR